MIYLVFPKYSYFLLDCKNNKFYLSCKIQITVLTGCLKFYNRILKMVFEQYNFSFITRSSNIENSRVIPSLSKFVYWR